MEIDLRNRNFLDMKYFSEEEILYLIDLAADFKKLKKREESPQVSGRAKLDFTFRRSLH